TKDSGRCRLRKATSRFEGMAGGGSTPKDPAPPPAGELRTGDCLAGMASLPDASVDVVITDPPYEAEAHTAQRMVARTGGRLECEPIAFPPLTEEPRTEA